MHQEQSAASEATGARPIEKAPTGIEGFDQITGGGLPRSRISMVVGGPGSGKTVFALQGLVNAARDRGEPGIFVAFEENAAQIVANAASFGWGLPELIDRSLYVFDARVSPDTVVVGSFDLTALLAILKAKADRTGARRIVFDAIDVLLTLMNDPAAERRELYRLQDWLLDSGLTGILTVKDDRHDPINAQRSGFMQFMVDCVVMLDHRIEAHVAQRGLRVLKYRGSSFAGNEFPFTISPSGLEVAGPSLVELVSDAASELPVPVDRVSTGVERLDTMLCGGYYRGTSVLISGNPGTAKSTLAGAFIEAACRRGERALYVSFDETSRETVRNLGSVGIRLGSFAQSGLLAMYSARTETRSAEEHLMAIRSLIRQHAPTSLVIDPISAMLKAGADRVASSVAQRLLMTAKEAGVTVVCTSLLDRPDGQDEATELPVSTLADTWIHLSYVVQGGERNRALTIVKSRGTKHSNQVRELILNDHGVSLSDVYTAGGAVLMGTARWERENQARTKRARAQAELNRKRRELALAEAEIQARIEALRRELEARQAEMAQILTEHQDETLRQTESRQGLHQMRSGDKPPH